MDKIGYIKVNLKIKNWNDLLSKIDEADLYESLNESYGLEKNPHITIFYGLDENSDVLKIENIINNIDYSKMDIKVSKIDFFHNENCDVMKFSIESFYLTKLNNIFSIFPNINKYTKYNPHITIAFLKKGSFEKYKDIEFYPEIKIDKAILKFKKK